jgi:arabinose-5-phosphate isomerase
MASRRPTPPADSLTSALAAVDSAAEGLATLRQALEAGLAAPLRQAVAAIGAARGRTIVTGMGKSGHIARKIAATLASTGTPAHFVHPGEASHGDLGMIQPEDVVLALSWSGETSELADIVAYTRRFRVLLIAITAQADSALGRQADIVLALPQVREACPNGLAPTTSTTLQIVLGDAIAVALLESRGFSSQDFRVFHPGGRLGAQLRQARSIMHGGDRLPLLPTGTAMSAALIEMSAKGFGCVIVVAPDGRLAGIITDGDLRRHMGETLMTASVDAVMTRTPITIAPDTLLAEALEIVETRKLGALIVCADDRPIGLIHVHDLLRAGVL